MGDGQPEHGLQGSPCRRQMSAFSRKVAMDKYAGWGVLSHSRPPEAVGILLDQ